MIIDVGILLQKADIQQVFQKLCIQYERRQNKRGYELYFLCPSGKHGDSQRKSASISEVGKYKGFFNCWSCGFRGNLIHLIQFLHNSEFKEAVQYLENDYGSAQVLGTEGLLFKLKMIKEEEEAKHELVDLELPKDFNLLTKFQGGRAREALDWLKNERNIGSGMIEKYEIGMSLHEDIGYAVTIPVRFKGRLLSIFYAQPCKGGMKRYPKNSPQGYIMFNYDRCLQHKKYIMMESILDVIKYDSVVGDEFGMACFTNMISDEQLELLKQFDEHGIMPDLDGERGWDLVDRMIPTVGKSAWIYFTPIGKDPGDCTPEELMFAKATCERYCDYESRQLTEHFGVEQTIVNCIRKK